MTVTAGLPSSILWLSRRNCLNCSRPIVADLPECWGHQEVTRGDEASSKNGEDDQQATNLLGHDPRTSQSSVDRTGSSFSPSPPAG